MIKKIISTFTLIISILALSFGVYLYNNSKTIAWFNYNEVYNKCELKKELEEKLKRVVSRRESHLDSLKLNLSLMSNKVKSGTASKEDLNLFEDMKNQYLSYQDNYERENVRLKEEYFSQIRSELNEKSKSFGKEKGFDFLFSAVGDGSLMYAKEGEEVTTDFLNYLNQ
ncbi:MAG: hypothetical protein COA32_02630 [Fluviicola sp.]|nr:MAG: hypothetical protein COA32_02630 [Fluviicola sp.]